jgi:hypothetical protein
MNHDIARCVRLLVLVAVSCGPASAQVTNIRIPDSSSSTGVTQNLIPFGSEFGAPPGAWSHLTIVPAGMLTARGAHAGDRLVDIEFAPTGTGMVHMPQVQVMVGHLVSPLPTFCLADGFADHTVVYDSAVSGPLDYACTANTWCSLQVGGGNFAWDGVSDLGIYTTHTGLTITSSTGWQGAFWRASSLMRHYRNTYQATMALTSALTGLRMGLVFADPAALTAALDFYGQGTPGSFGAPAIDPNQLPAFGNQSFGLGMVGSYPGSIAALLVSSGIADWQIGAGADVRLLVDVSANASWFPVFVPVDSAGSAFFSAPVPNYTPALAGFRVFCQWAVIGDPNGRPTIFGVPLALSDAVAVTVGVF